MAAMGVLKETYQTWRDDNAILHGAALAYYGVLSVGPLLLLAITIAGLVFGRDASQGQLMTQIQGVAGEQLASTLQSLIAGMQGRSSGLLIGLLTLLLAASGVFLQLRSSLNQLWGAGGEGESGIRGTARNRVLAFLMVFGIGLLLLASLVLNAVLTGLRSELERFLPPTLSGWTLPLIQIGTSLVVFALLFAMVYKVLPDVTLAWRDVWVGGLITAVLFVIGQFLIALYLGYSGMASSYGAAGAVILLLVWFYYSGQIFFFGAEFTKVYARRYGSQRAARPGRMTRVA
jgi:membrane protein